MRLALSEFVVARYVNANIVKILDYLEVLGHCKEVMCSSKSLSRNFGRPMCIIIMQTAVHAILSAYQHRNRCQVCNFVLAAA